MRRRNKLLTGILSSVFGISACIAAFSFGEDEYSPYNNMKYYKKLDKQIELSLSIKAIFENKANQSSGGNQTANPQQSVGTTMENTATNGIGLNLLLINSIETEGFVKEYLSICLENQNGDLDRTKRDKYASVLATIGINISESGFYKAGDGSTLPTTDLPADANGTPMWDGGDYSLKKWTVNSRNANGGGGSQEGGPFQFISGGKLTRIDTTSKYHDGLLANLIGVGDCYFFPDAVCGLNGYVKSAIDWHGGFKSASDEAVAVATVISHNRGAGGLAMMLGIPYHRIFNQSRTVTSFIDKNAVSGDEIGEYFNELYHDTVNIPDTVSADQRVGIQHTGYFKTLFGYVSNGWMFNPAAGMNAKRKYNDEARMYWNAIFPNEQVSNVNEYNAAIDRHTSKLSTALGISDGDCDAIYGTTGGDYPNYHSNYTYGTVFKVTDHVSNAYKKGTGARVVYSLEAICAEHVFVTFGSAELVYAKMLKYAGVDVDMTNPSSYLGGYEDNQQWVPPSTGEIDQAALTTLIANGLDQSAINAERLSVLERAAGLVGIAYKQCRHFAGCDGFCYDNMGARPTHLDCSSFVWRSYKEAGFDMSGFPTNTASYAGTPAFTEISFNELKPGDVLVQRRSNGTGHAELFLGKDVSTAYFVEAKSTNSGCCYRKRPVSEIIGAEYKYYCYSGFQ